MDIKIKPLNPALIEDYLYFFDNLVFTENPGWSKCYCYSFHFIGASKEWTKKNNRASVIDYISQGKMKGYLAYADDKPVGWCNANNRLNYERLLKYYDLIDKESDGICSIVCFVTNPEYRRQGIAQKILEQAITDYTSQNYNYIEAYPGKGELSCEKHYKGPLDMYLKSGFEIVKDLKNQLVVRKQLRVKN